jgi:hypothetical protein
MGTIDSLRRRAEECRELAQWARTDDVRAQWLEMAETWTQLAKEQYGPGAALA